MNQQQLPATIATAYHDVIMRAAQDPNFDIDKMERLMAMQEAREQRGAELAFHEALAACEAEMGPIAADANNPQTRSRYATYARLDGEIRPIYTRHGFSISFTTEPSGEADTVRVVGMLANGMISRRHQIDMPIETSGARGQQYTTKTWARMSAVTYGKRNLLTLMFNLTVGDEREAGARPAPAMSRTKPQQPAGPLCDPETGEVIEHPVELPFLASDTWTTWGQRIVQAMQTGNVDEWLRLNAKTVERMKTERPQYHATLMERAAFAKQWKEEVVGGA
jgi:hypothetical protein